MKNPPNKVYVVYNQHTKKYAGSKIHSQPQHIRRKYKDGRHEEESKFLDVIEYELKEVRRTPMVIFRDKENYETNILIDKINNSL